MSKDPAFLFYPSDFLTGTMYMSFQEKGIYICLLCSQHQHGGIIDKASFNSLVGDNLLLKSKFIESESGFYNERLAIEMDKRNKKSNNMSDAAKLVWNRRKEEKNTIVLQKQSKSNTKVKENDTIVIQPVNENKDINIIKDNSIIPSMDEFLNFCKTITEFNYFEYEFSLKTKYETWVSDGWKDGNGNKIKNWKTKIKNTYPFLKSIKSNQTEPTKKRKHLTIE